MLVGHVILALLLAALAVASLTIGIRFPAPRRAARALFILLFLATWAGGVWLAPFGPPIGNVYWLPFTLVAILVAILIAAVVPAAVHTQAEAVDREEEIEAGLGVFFWVLIGALIVAIALRYLR